MVGGGEEGNEQTGSQGTTSKLDSDCRCEWYGRGGRKHLTNRDAGSAFSGSFVARWSSQFTTVASELSLEVR